jgi:hypothetical protein
MAMPTRVPSPPVTMSRVPVVDAVVVVAGVAVVGVELRLALMMTILSTGLMVMHQRRQTRAVMSPRPVRIPVTEIPRDHIGAVVGAVGGTRTRVI